MRHTPFNPTPEIKQNFIDLAYLLETQRNEKFNIYSWKDGPIYIFKAIKLKGSHSKYSYMTTHFFPNFGVSYAARCYYEWCFSECWKDTDNTASGCAKRIKYLLEKGIPENWFSQMVGTNELSYK